jgi:transposase InsO family protein
VGNGVYLLEHTCPTKRLPFVESLLYIARALPRTAQCDHVMWHKRFRHLNMQSLQAQYSNGIPLSHEMPSYVTNISFYSRMLNKASAAPRNTSAFAKPPHPLMNLSSDMLGPMNVPSPHGLRYYLLVIDSHTIFMWVRFWKSKDDTLIALESNILELRHLYARFHSDSGLFAPILKFDLDSVFEAAPTRRTCGKLGVGVHFSAPYAHYMLGKTERLWRTLRDNA